MIAAILLSLLGTVIAAFLAKQYIYTWLKRRSLGKSSITTSSVQFDSFKHGQKITWDKHCFYINGKPIMLFSGEFHYWRLPDQTRWKSILMQYKAGGLNCIRIYFHWGYHSPDENVYLFDNGRDLDYLLTLCEELQLFVLAAPGPYICAETQAGGLPLWVTAKRNLNIRNTKMTLFREFDENYTNYELQWYSHVMPILARHQITAKDNGCVLAVQIENEYFEEVFGIPFGLLDHMRILAKSARDNGITVPLFTNDAFEAGSLVTRPDNSKYLDKNLFGIDLYGFDKYVVFCPTSSPFALFTGGNNDKSTWGEWSPKDVIKAFSTTEKTVRSFGGGAAQSPIFIPELQGGWFNHYTVKSTYDDVYNYYGESYTKMVMETAMAQGSTAFSMYMFYGGTNWGTLGDPDVYTSYDYSACIREFGHFSGRGRMARLALMFGRSFEKLLTKTETEDLNVRDSFTISASLKDYLSQQRRTVGLNQPYFLFFRNLTADKASGDLISFKRQKGQAISLKSKLPYKESFIGLANYFVQDIHLLVSTIPIHAKLEISGNEVWIIQCDDKIDGQFAFSTDVNVSGSLEPIISEVDGVQLVSFKENAGSAIIKSEKTSIYVIALTGKDLLTLGAVYEESYWVGETRIKGLFWGAYGVKYDVPSKELIIQQTADDEIIYGISDGVLPAEFVPDPKYPGIDFLKSYNLTKFVKPDNLVPVIEFAERKDVDFAQFQWNPVKMLSKKERESTIDRCFTSGHAAYKFEFDLTTVPAKAPVFDVNSRHRCTIYVNGQQIGSHMTYSLALLRPGAKNGPDFGQSLGLGTKKYNVATNLLKVGKNQIVCIVESFGLNRIPGFLYDVHTPRGIISANLTGQSLEWFIAGVDVRKLSNVFNHTGIPADDQPFKHLDLNIKGDAIPKGLKTPTVFRGTFIYKNQAVAPLRLNITGDNCAYVSINDTVIARHYSPEEGPQVDFYVPEGLLNESNTIEVMTYGSTNESALFVRFDLWKIDGLLASGNVKEDGVDFILNEVRVRFE